MLLVTIAAAVMTQLEPGFGAGWEGTDDFSGALDKWDTTYVRADQPTNGFFIDGGRLQFIRGMTRTNEGSSGALIWLKSLPFTTNWIVAVEAHLKPLSVRSSVPTDQDIRAALYLIESVETSFSGEKPKFVETALGNDVTNDVIQMEGPDLLVAGWDFTLGISFDANTKIATSFYYPSNQPAQVALLGHANVGGWTNMQALLYALSEYWAVGSGEVWLDNFRVSGTADSPPQIAIPQVFGNLHHFTGADGDGPWAGLILAGNTLYGTTPRGGSWGCGTVFKVNRDGTGFTTLHHFAGGSDGDGPIAGLLLSGNTLYGTTPGGGTFSNGTLFAVNTDGSGFTTLHHFTGTDEGFNPAGPLIMSGNTLYGTASSGATNANGAVFKINTDGSGFATVWRFSVLRYDPSTGVDANSDGACPQGGLVLSGSTLYGTTSQGGLSGSGTVFKVNTNGSALVTLHSFAATRDDGSGAYTNGDGSFSRAGLVLSGSTLYGTTYLGGTSGRGTVFKVNTDGSGFATLYSFTAGGTNSFGSVTNTGGAWPGTDLLLSGDTLYGTTMGGGIFGYGTLLAVNTDGTGFTVLRSFNWEEGALPGARLALSGSTLYGTGDGGGRSGYGTVFSLSYVPQLTATSSGTTTVLTWPTNPPLSVLQSTTNLVSPTSWTSVSPGPVIVNGRNAVTNRISGGQRFYRLSL